MLPSLLLIFAARKLNRLKLKCDFIKQFTSLCYPGHNNLDDLWLAQANDLSRINTHGLQHKENCIQRNVLLDAICTKSTTYIFFSFSGLIYKWLQISIPVYFCHRYNLFGFIKIGMNLTKTLDRYFNKICKVKL